ncbi:MAG: LamG domain-containing protein, partial [Chloroflexi bacterium]
VNSWHQIVVWHDSVNDEMYVVVDGVTDSRSNPNGVFNSTANFTVGRIETTGATSDYDGRIDELRFLSEIPSTDWIATEYNNISSPSTFYSEITAEESQRGPVSYWKFDEAINNTCKDGTSDICDSTQESNDGTMTGGTWQTEDLCVSGNCMFFDGSDDVATFTNNPSIDFDNGLKNGWSFGAWIRASSDGENNVGEIFNKGSTYLRVDTEGSDGYADLEFNLDLTTTDANVNVSDGIQLDRWHYVEVTHDGTSTANVYIDGLLRGTNTGSGVMSTDSNDLLIGGKTTANFHGFIDDARIYDYERTAGQIKSDSIGLGGSGNSASFSTQLYKYLSNGLVGYWRLDEASANTCTGGTNDSCDSSGNQYDGAWVGATTSATGKFGKGTSFSATNDGITVSASSSFLPEDEFTISAWIYVNSIGQYNPIIGS